ncbi:hypothetical protein FKM82_000782 [Ascaphus truei]
MGVAVIPALVPLGVRGVTIIPGIILYPARTPGCRAVPFEVARLAAIKRSGRWSWLILHMIVTLAISGGRDILRQHNRGVFLQGLT